MKYYLTAYAPDYETFLNRVEFASLEEALNFFEAELVGRKDEVIGFPFNAEVKEGKIDNLSFLWLDEHWEHTLTLKCPLLAATIESASRVDERFLTEIKMGIVPTITQLEDAFKMIKRIKKG